MRLNGDSAESPNENDELLESENQDVAARVADLERRVLEQGDELVCLKATLAEALRRLAALESMRSAASATQPRPLAAQSTPLRNGTNGKEVRMLRPQTFSGIKLDTRPSSLPQKKSFHYQSTNSLHSDSHSSSSVSPIPSPSPLPLMRRPPLAVPQITPSTNGSPALHKRWSSTGDFNQVNSLTSPQSRFSNKSFLNLFIKNNQVSASVKHGTKDATYNEEDRTLKVFMRGRPVHLAAPSEITSAGYDPMKVETAPSRRLKLDWVYGYRGRDCRSNLYFLPTGEMVYFVASVVVLYNQEEQSQRHYLGHTDEVKSIAIHPNKLLIASGQCSGFTERSTSRPHVRIWNSVTLQTQAVIGSGDFAGSVCCLSFSKADGGSLLVAIDDCRTERTISVWDWRRGDRGWKIAETKCSVDTIVSAEFHPLDRNRVVTCGKAHVGFWTLDANVNAHNANGNGAAAVSATLYKRTGIFETRDKPKYVTCVAFLQSDGDAVTGDSNGNLTVWGRATNTIQKLVRNMHDGPVFAICVLRDGSVVTGGGRDGRVQRLDVNMRKIEDDVQIEGHFGGIRVISEGRGSQLLVGTTRNCILVGNNSIGFQPIVLGHAEEIWALSSHPTVQQFATAGHDRLLQMWDAMSHSILWSKDIGEQAQCAAFSPDGTSVAVGCLTGRWMVFDSQTRELLCQYTDGSESIQVIQHSPEGSMVAIGSRDNNIYVYQSSDGGSRYSKVGRCTGHSSFITHIDWSSDSQVIRSNSGDYELFYWNPITCRQITQMNATRDVDWSTNTCTLTFTSIGIWPETGADGTEVNACDRSHDRCLMTTADDSGKVKLYSYPVVQPKSLNHCYGGHSGQATNVTFLHDDTRLISIGGKDTSVLQWTVL